MTPKIETYPDLSNLDNKTINSIIAHEREAFGYKGYGEYLFCSNAECRRIQSIDEVYGTSDNRDKYVPLEELEANASGFPCCPDCKSPTLLVFDTETFKPYLASIYRNAYGSLLRDEMDVVRGTCVFQNMTLSEFFVENMDYKESFDWDEFRSRTGEILKMDASSDTPLVSTNRVSIARPFREGKTFHDICLSTLNLRPNNDNLPAIASVRFDGNVLPALKAIGYKELVRDEFGTVAIGIPHLGQAREAFNRPSTEFYSKFGGAMKEISVDAATQESQTYKAKYYKGMKLLDALQVSIENWNRTEGHDMESISPENITELSYTFIELFCNAYGQYVFYPSSQGKAISPQELFKKDEFITFDKLYSVDLNDYADPETGEAPMFWHDPKIVQKKLSHLLKNGQLAITRNASSNEIDAFTFGYSATVGEAFKNEEWENPMNYSGMVQENMLRDCDSFLEAINNTISQRPDVFSDSKKLDEDSKVYIWNAFGVMPDSRGQGLMKMVTKKVSSMIPNDVTNRIGLLEAQPGSIAHKIFQDAGAINVPEALNKPNEKSEDKITLMTFKLSDFISYFSKA